MRFSRHRPRRPVLWGGRRRDYQVGGPEDRARSLILRGTAAYRAAAVRLFADVAPAVRKLDRALRAAQAAAEPGIRSTPDRIEELDL